MFGALDHLMRQLTLDYFKINLNISQLVSGDIASYLNSQATLVYFKIDRKVLKIMREDIDISQNRQVTLGFIRHALNIICTDNMRSCDMRSILIG